MRRLIPVAISLVLVSCVSLTPTGEKVRVTANPEAVRNCTLLGEVNGAEHMWGGAAGQGIAENNADTELKNRTAAKGGDTVLIVTSSTIAGVRIDSGFSGSVQRGKVYRCQASAPSNR